MAGRPKKTGTIKDEILKQEVNIFGYHIKY